MRHALDIRRFLSFGAVGTIGFVVDSLVLLALLALGLGKYSGRVVSFFCAATTTWALNRRFTFRPQAGQRSRQEWSRYLLVNATGGAVNYGVYAGLVTCLPLVARHPVLGVAAGSIAGLAFNYLGSALIVFPDRTRTAGGTIHKTSR